MILALAGRRVDALDAKDPRFPLQNVDLVKSRVRATLETQAAATVVSSAACGADLIALREAGFLGLRRRVILPFDPVRFRETSVTDRPGDWGPVYDQVLVEVEAAGDLLILEKASEMEAYSAVNERVLEEAASLAAKVLKPAIAVLIWDGVSRGEDDLTEAFGRAARAREMKVVEVLTL